MISAPIYFTALAMILLMFWGIYKLASKLLLSTIITWIHILITLLSITLLSLIVNFNNLPKDTLDLSALHTFYHYQELNANLALYLVLGQSLFLINLIGGFIKRLNNR